MKKPTHRITESGFGKFFFERLSWYPGGFGCTPYWHTVANFENRNEAEEYAKKYMQPLKVIAEWGAE